MRKNTTLATQMESQEAGIVLVRSISSDIAWALRQFVTFNIC